MCYQWNILSWSFYKKYFVQIGIFRANWSAGRRPTNTILGFGFSRCFSSVYILYNTYFFKTFLWRPPSNIILWRPLSCRTARPALNPALITVMKGFHSKCQLSLYTISLVHCFASSSIFAPSFSLARFRAKITACVQHSFIPCNCTVLFFGLNVG